MLVKVDDVYIDPDSVRAITPGANGCVRIFFKNVPNQIIVQGELDDVAQTLDPGSNL